MSLEDAKALALKIMSKTMDSTKLGSEKRKPPPCPFAIHCSSLPSVEFATMTLHAETKEPVAKIYRASELDELLRKLELGGTPDSEVTQGTGGGGAQEGSVSIST